MYDVSAIITTFERPCSIVEKAILSVINQSYKISEIIVIDDNKNNSVYCEDLRKMCSKYPVVRYIKQNGNLGACAARNLGISNAVSDFIGFLDDDDEWLPQKIKLQIDVFKNSTDDNLGMVFCSGVTNAPEGVVDYYNYKDFCKTPSLIDMLIKDRVGSTSNPLIRKQVFKRVGGFWEKQPARQDYEMWIRITKDYKIVGIEEKLFVHNIHIGEQISKSTRKAYCGYKNIYKRYKNCYKKNHYAMYCIISNIYKNMYSFSFFNISITFKKILYKTLKFYKKND